MIIHTNRFYVYYGVFNSKSPKTGDALFITSTNESAKVIWYPLSVCVLQRLSVQDN